MTSSQRTPASCQWFDRLADALDKRSAPRLALLFLGAVLARGRRTVTTWIRAARLNDQFRPCYTAVAAAGRKADVVAASLVLGVIKPLAAGTERLTLAIDDTPTRRYGPHVQEAGVHHDPTPGPAGSSYRVRPRLRRPGTAARSPGVGRGGAAATVPAVRPPEGPSVCVR